MKKLSLTFDFIEFFVLVKDVFSVEEDLVLETDTGLTQVIRCPITQKEIEEEWKNPKCGHVYEKNAIIGYCRKGARKCPIAGCQSNVLAR